MNLKEQVNTL